MDIQKDLPEMKSQLSNVWGSIGNIWQIIKELPGWIKRILELLTWLAEHIGYIQAVIQKLEELLKQLEQGDLINRYSDPKANILLTEIVTKEYLKRIPIANLLPTETNQTFPQKDNQKA